MKTIVSEFQFIESFRRFGRESQFSVPARRALFAHFKEFEQESGAELELDPIGICCEFAEYPSALEAAKDCGFGDNENDTEEAAFDWLHEKTQIVPLEGGIIIQQF